MLTILTGHLFVCFTTRHTLSSHPPKIPHSEASFSAPEFSVWNRRTEGTAIKDETKRGIFEGSKAKPFWHVVDFVEVGGRWGVEEGSDR